MPIDNIEVLKKLDLNKQLVFSYLTCERLYPNYVYFSDNYKFGNKKALREAINFIYNNLLINNLFNNSDIHRHLKAVNSNIPRPENFNTILASSALDACTTVLETLDFILDKKSIRLNDVSTFATDTVDMYIQEKYNLDFNTDQEFEQKIINHPLMQKELAVQKGIISYLAQINKLEISDIDNLLKLQANGNKSNIGL
jgi:uncharacterized protein YjaG (DUF416 family)